MEEAPWREAYARPARTSEAVRKVMKMTDSFATPDELELLEFFCAEPAKRSVDDGYWCYEATDDRGVTLRFSFNLFERSVQTVILVGGKAVATVAHEGARSMIIAAETLICRFSFTGAEAKLVLRLKDSVSVEWSSLRSQ